MPTAVATEPRGASSPAKPALVVYEPRSTTIAIARSRGRSPTSRQTTRTERLRAAVRAQRSPHARFPHLSTLSFPHLRAAAAQIEQNRLKFYFVCFLVRCDFRVTPPAAPPAVARSRRANHLATAVRLRAVIVGHRSARSSVMPRSVRSLRSAIIHCPTSDSLLSCDSEVGAARLPRGVLPV